MNGKWKWGVGTGAVLYLGILIGPGIMGKAVDKAEGSFGGSMTALGGRAVRLRAAATMDWIRAAGVAGGGVCEIGPGRGVLAREADRRDYCYFAIDCDPAAIARVRHIATAVCVARVPPMPVNLGPMNAIVCENVLEHMSGYAEAADLVRGFYDGLYPGGCLVLRCPDVRYTQWGFWDNAQDHQYVTTLRRVTMLCREAGFEIERCGYSFDHLSGARGQWAYLAKRCFPWRLMHNLFYAPWMTSPWSTLADKVPHAYVVAVKKGES
jgi:SAM-dependent methyltransferase